MARRGSSLARRECHHARKVEMKKRIIPPTKIPMSRTLPIPQTPVMPVDPRMPVPLSIPANSKQPLTDAQQNLYMNRYMRRAAGRGEIGPGSELQQTEEQRLKDMLAGLGDSKTRKAKSSGKSGK